MGIEKKSIRRKRMEVLPVVELVFELLRKADINAIACGEIRRECPTIMGGIPVVVNEQPRQIIDIVERNLFGVVSYTFLDETKNRVSILLDSILFSFWFASSDEWGAMKLALTGPAGFTVAIRGEAKRQGYKLNSTGLWFLGDRIAGRSEKQIFLALGLKFVHPIERTKKVKFLHTMRSGEVLFRALRKNARGF